MNVNITQLLSQIIMYKESQTFFYVVTSIHPFLSYI